jgi:hypothetical protein
MTGKVETLFERVAGPLTLLHDRLAVGRCPSCGTEKSLFIDLKIGTWRCGRLPSSLHNEFTTVSTPRRQVKNGE